MVKRPLLGTTGGWFLYDIVEYGLKQNDAAIFDAGTTGNYSDSVLGDFFKRLLVISSVPLGSKMGMKDKDIQKYQYHGSNGSK